MPAGTLPCPGLSNLYQARAAGSASRVCAQLPRPRPRVSRQEGVNVAGPPPAGPLLTSAPRSAQRSAAAAGGGTRGGRAGGRDSAWPRGRRPQPRQHVRQGAPKGQSDQGQRHPPALLLLRGGEWAPRRAGRGLEPIPGIRAGRAPLAAPPAASDADPYVMLRLAESSIGAPDKEQA